MLLTTFAWNYLVYREGVPDWEKKYEGHSPERDSERARRLHKREAEGLVRLI